MHATLLALTLVVSAQTTELRPGRHARSVAWQGQERPYHFYVPTGYDPARPAPVVLALHGAAMSGQMMEKFCGLTTTAEKNGFIVVYPNGAGPALVRTWNSGAFPGKLAKADDVGMIARLLDDLATVARVDPKRIFCTGMSNGAMMSYRLAAELSDRIAAIAPVAGTMVVEQFAPKRAVPVLHFHGTKDVLVPFDGLAAKNLATITSVETTIRRCIAANGCQDDAEVSAPPPHPLEKDLKVVRKAYNHGKDGAEVVLYIIEGGGHVWPGRPSPGGFLGASTFAISANDLMWEFFQKHPLK